MEHELKDGYFAIANVSVIYLEQVSQAFRLEIGTDIGYWFGLNANSDGTIASRDLSNLTIGFTIQPEIIIDRFTLVRGAKRKVQN